jgi:catechol 2,3-dioxygenase-like lactoylglutathione lyase family enzyme
MIMAGVVGTNLFAQVGFIVRDVEATKRKWAAFLGVDVPETQPVGDYEITGTTFMGQPAPKANCNMAFFDVGPGLQLELIEPNEEPSTWRNFLNEHGEGMHHIAFQVRDSARQVANAEAAGLATAGRSAGSPYGRKAMVVVCADRNLQLAQWLEIAEVIRNIGLDVYLVSEPRKEPGRR